MIDLHYDLLVFQDKESFIRLTLSKCYKGLGGCQLDPSITQRIIDQCFISSVEYEETDTVTLYRHIAKRLLSKASNMTLDQFENYLSTVLIPEDIPFHHELTISES